MFTSIMPRCQERVLGLSRISAIAACFTAILAAAEKPAPAPTPTPAPAQGQQAVIQKMQEAAEKQRLSVQKQAGPPPAKGFFTVGWSSPDPFPPPPAAPIECTPTAEKDIEPLIATAAGAQQLKPELIRAIIREESGYRACAVSDRGAMGLMQIMPETAEQFQTADPFDPAQNINTGARYLKQLLDRYKGDLKLALAAYNAGPSRVDGNPPAPPNFPETQDYVTRIMDSLAKTDQAEQAKQKSQ